MNIAPRRCLREVTPYLPGKSIASVKRELGLKRVIKLASNENALGPSPRAMAAYRRAAKEFHYYPEGPSPELREALARYHKVSPERVVISNGSDGMLRLICEAFVDPEDEVIVSQYSFIRFRQHAKMMSAKIIEVPMVDWTHDLKTMGRTASKRTKLLFIANPNNPTGTYNTPGEMRELMELVPSTTLVVLDEAYYHFAAAEKDYPQSIPNLVKRYDNLMVMRTFSKAYGLAGLRVGYAIADPEVLSWIERIRLPFNVNLPAQRAALAALEDTAFLRRSVTAASTCREKLEREVRALGFGVVEGMTNFLFVRSPIPGRDLFKILLKSGVIVRPLDEYGLPNHVRMSFGLPAQNKLLVSLLKRAVEVAV